MENYYNMAFIGAGNIAWHLAPAFENYGHKVSLVFNRTKKNTQALISRLYDATIQKNLDFSKSNLDVIIIAVKDSIIESVVSEIIIPDDCCLIHTSGTLPMDILKISASSHYGVLYPLQTFTKGIKLTVRETPVFLEANDDYSFRILQNLTRTLSKNMYKIDSKQRSMLHLSAVIGSNFSNHMLTIAKSIMDTHHMDFNLLQNLISSTFQKAFEVGPEKGQTGPAVRKDEITLKRHLKLLKGDRDLQKLYSLISDHIKKNY
jgi:predicted short-subunit dehydrogenase-like oxidoreductase (DUF2520 family)